MFDQSALISVGIVVFVLLCIVLLDWIIPWRQGVQESKDFVESKYKKIERVNKMVQIKRDNYEWKGI